MVYKNNAELLAGVNVILLMDWQKVHLKWLFPVAKIQLFERKVMSPDSSQGRSGLKAGIKGKWVGCGPDGNKASL